MTDVRSSANYKWRTTSVLGKGTFGIVFQGVSKYDGEFVAVKTFNQISPQEAQLRELQVLKKLKHENIAKLLAIEEERNEHGKVIVMELCTGGSLHTILDDPENAYGLPEDDFLLVLSHLSAGMKYLRDNNIVHRDLKPGNIMKFIAEDGRVIFKLVDFGAARELEKDQEFLSLHGTAEYCHPDMYERAVLRKPISTGGKTAFSASVDLWSIGVTLYHVATGSLPFRPYGGKKNTEMMHFITTKKETGVISGWQLTENGQIEWKRELPTTCQISNGLKHLITPLLAGLMEVNERKMWTYDVFFNAVAKIMAKTRVHIFYLNKVQALRVYIDLDPQRSPVSTIPYSSTTSSLSSTTHCKILQTFRKLIQVQTEINPENQIILQKEGNLAEAQFKFVLPATSEENPVILCDKENINVVFDWDMRDLPKFPKISIPMNVDLENDTTLAKLSCAVGYSYERKIEKIALHMHVLTLAVEIIRCVITQGLTSVSNNSCAKIQSQVRAVGQLFSLMEQTQKNYAALKGMEEGESQNSSTNASMQLQELTGLFQARLDSIGKSSSEQAHVFRQLQQPRDFLEQPTMHGYCGVLSIQGPCHIHTQSQGQFSRQIQINSYSNSIFNNYHNSSAASCIARAGKKALTNVGKLRESWQHLSRDKVKRSWTHNDEQFHIYAKRKMQNKSKCLFELLYKECQPAIARLTDMFSTWYKLAQPVLIQSGSLVKDMNILGKDVQDFVADTVGILEGFQTNMEVLTLTLKGRKEFWQKQQEEILRSKTKKRKAESTRMNELDIQGKKNGPSRKYSAQVVLPVTPGQDPGPGPAHRASNSLPNSASDYEFKMQRVSSWIMTEYPRRLKVCRCRRKCAPYSTRMSRCSTCS